MTKKLILGVLFGGRSAEHEVSIRSAKNIIEALDKKKFSPTLIGIDKDGKWFLNDLKAFLKKQKIDRKEEVAFVPAGTGKIFNLKTKKTIKVDVVFPILHGPFGEDGTVQGLLKLADVPFVGPGVLGSSAGMDKEITKRILRDSGLPVGKFLVFRNYEKIDYDATVQELGLPLFIKPANLGSSVGISKAKNKEEFDKAVKEAFKYDRKILVEEFIKGREIECAVLGNDEVKAATPGEVAATHDFYSYEAKYLDDNGARLEVPANIPEEIQNKVKEMAIKTFKALSCEGLSRVDFFLKGNGDILVNEINTIPGFTSISMYPRMWQASGKTYSGLITELIDLAIKRFQKESKLKTSR